MSIHRLSTITIESFGQLCCEIDTIDVHTPTFHNLESRSCTLDFHDSHHEVRALSSNCRGGEPVRKGDVHRCSAVHGPESGLDRATLVSVSTPLRTRDERNGLREEIDRLQHDDIAILRNLAEMES
jgi:hypothetical protein